MNWITEPRRAREAGVAVRLHDAVDEHDEGARRPADLHAAAAEDGDQEARDDRGVEALLGLDSRRDAEGDRERQRHHADDHAGHDVARELRRSVSLAQHRHELRLEPAPVIRRVLHRHARV
jgi:hypothetical protein